MAETADTLTKQNTDMAIHRTRMSADRTLMSIIRTSLSLIGFGFTLHQVFRKAYEAGAIAKAEAPRNFGLALILVGILLLVGGIVRHLQFAAELRGQRRRMGDEALITYPVSVTLISAVALLLIGVVAAISVL